MARYTPAVALLVVDVQNDFADPGGGLYVPDGEQVVPVVAAEVHVAWESGSPVFYTQDWHPADTPHFAKDGGTWPVHCVQHTRGAEFHPDIIDDPRIVVVSKGMGDEDNYSAFDGTNLAALLRERGIEEVWVGGLATDYCVKNTVLDAVREGFKVRAVEDAMRPVNLQPDDGAHAIDEMCRAGAKVILKDEGGGIE